MTFIVSKQDKLFGPAEKSEPSFGATSKNRVVSAHRFSDDAPTRGQDLKQKAIAKAPGVDAPQIQNLSPRTDDR